MVAGTGHANWQRNLLVNLVKHKSMLPLSSHPDNSQDDNKLDLSSIKVYQCMTKFIQCWAKYVAISIIIGNGVEAEGQCPPIYVLYREGNSRSVLRVIPTDVQPKKLFGQVYYEFEYKTQTHHSIEDLDVKMYGVLLPYPDGNLDTRFYSIITDQWSILDDKYNIHSPLHSVDMSQLKLFI